MIEAIYPLALERGILPDVFWQSSVLEVLDMINAHERAKEEDIRREIEIQFTAAEAIATRIAYIFGDEKKRSVSDILQPWNAYPKLFEDRSEELARVEQRRDIAKFRNGMTAYAARWNKRNNHGDNTSI